MTTDPNLKHIRIEVDPKQHRDIRLASASKDVTMTEFVRVAAIAAAEKGLAILTAGDTRDATAKRQRKHKGHRDD